MSISDDREYFQSRAAYERQQASAAASPTIAAVHEELARGYEALVRRLDDECRPPRRTAAPVGGAPAPCATGGLAPDASPAFPQSGCCTPDC